MRTSEARRPAGRPPAVRGPLDDARRRFVESNLGLAGLIARRLRGPGRVPFEDLLQEAAIGLMIASAQFDPRRGVKASTYAAWWIKSRVARERLNSNVIRVPVRLANAATADGDRGGGDPALLAAARRARATVSADVAISAPDSGRATTLAASIPAPDREGIEPDQAARIAEMMGALPDREREVLRRKYWHGESLAEVARAMGITREWARRLEEKGLDALREGHGLPRRGAMRLEANNARRREARARRREARAAGESRTFQGRVS